MFAAQETTEVHLLCEASVMKAVIDKFGPDVRTKEIGTDRFSAKVRVCVTPTFFRWVFGWNGRIRIERPKEVKEKYRLLLGEELRLYNKDASP